MGASSCVIAHAKLAEGQCVKGLRAQGLCGLPRLFPAVSRARIVWRSFYRALDVGVGSAKGRRPRILGGIYPVRFVCAGGACERGTRVSV